MSYATYSNSIGPLKGQRNATDEQSALKMDYNGQSINSKATESISSRAYKPETAEGGKKDMATAAVRPPAYRKGPGGCSELTVGMTTLVMC